MGNHIQGQGQGLGHYVMLSAEALIQLEGQIVDQEWERAMGKYSREINVVRPDAQGEWLIMMDYVEGRLNVMVDRDHRVLRMNYG